MGVQVNHAGRQYQAVGLHARSGVFTHLADFRHTAAANGKVALLQRIAETIGDARISYYQVVHACPLPFKTARGLPPSRRHGYR